MGSKYGVVFFIASLFLVSCAVREASVDSSTKTSFHVIVPFGAKRYVLEKNQKFVLGQSVSQVLPIYPSGLLNRGISAQNVCLEITMDATGAVVSSRPVYGSLACPLSENPVVRSFEDAARQAVAQWRFEPAKLCTYPDGVDAEDAGNDCRDARVEYVPLKLAFDFEFVNRHGVAAVNVRESR